MLIFSLVLTERVIEVQVNLDMMDSMGPGKKVRHMQNLSYTYDEYLICIGLGPSISSVICKNLSYSGPSSSLVYNSGAFLYGQRTPFLRLTLIIHYSK